MNEKPANPAPDMPAAPAPDMAHDAEAAARPSATRHPGLRATTGRRRWLSVAVALGLMAMAAAAVVGYRVGDSAAATRSDESAEAGFARDMQVHHAQAVEMSLIVREKSNDPALRAMAYDVITSQQQQIGQMYAWLEAWSLPQTSQRAPMSWMSAMDHDAMQGMSGMSTGADSMRLLPDGRMPGMASAADLARLRAARGRAAEVLWLQLMIPHHQAGVMMAEAILQQSKDPQVVRLATAIRTAQLAEIDQMRQMLTARSASEKTP